MSVAAAKKSETSPTAGNKTASKTTTSATQRDERDVGHALRAAYKTAVDEAIPAEMLDLLNKLR